MPQGAPIMSTRGLRVSYDRCAALDGIDLDVCHGSARPGI
jgi:hypothetical protein